MREARVHGGALDAAVARFGGTRGDWLDLSTGIHPLAPPLPTLAPEAWARLPEAGEAAALEAAARRFYGVRGKASIVQAPGTQSLISLWPHLFAPCEAAVVSPTYAEHERALGEAGHRVRPIAAPGDLPADARLLVAVNPNNPDGRRFARAELLGLAETLAGRGGLLVVDEAFMDADPAESLAGEAGRQGLLVLRSFGKFFGLAGLRLGFALADETMGAKLAARLGPWAVSGPALRIAASLMADDRLIVRQRVSAQQRSASLLAALGGAGLPVEGSTPLFALARHGRADALFEALARRRILTRPFAGRGDWLRFGLPADEAEAARLRRALGEALAETGR